MTFLTNTSVLFQLRIWLWIQKFNSRKCWQKIESYLRQASEWPKRNQTMIKCHSWWISHIWHQASNPVFGHFSNSIFFQKMGQPRPLFCLFSFFSQCSYKYSTNLTMNHKSIDGALGTQTRGGWMEGVYESTELWRHPNQFFACFHLGAQYNWKQPIATLCWRSNNTNFSYFHLILSFPSLRRSCINISECKFYRK